MKARFVVLALFIFGCATGISHAQDDGERANAAVVSVRDIDFLEPSPRLADFVVGQTMQGVRFSREAADARASSSESKPAAKRHRIGRVLTESCRELLGVVATEVVCAARDDLPQETTALTAESMATCFHFFRRFGFGQRHGSAVSESRRQRQQKSGADGRGRAVVVCRRRKKRDCRSSCLSALLPLSLSACAMRCRAGG